MDDVTEYHNLDSMAKIYKRDIMAQCPLLKNSSFSVRIEKSRNFKENREYEIRFNFKRDPISDAKIVINSWINLFKIPDSNMSTLLINKIIVKRYDSEEDELLIYITYQITEPTARIYEFSTTVIDMSQIVKPLSEDEENNHTIKQNRAKLEELLTRDKNSIIKAIHRDCKIDLEDDVHIIVSIYLE